MRSRPPTAELNLSLQAPRQALVSVRGNDPVATSALLSAFHPESVQIFQR